MNQNVYVKEYLTKKEKDINALIAKFILAFLILIPSILIAREVGMLTLGIKEMLWLFIGIFVLAIAPIFITRYSYNEAVNRCICLTCLEVLVCIFSLNKFLELNIIFLLVPLVSLLYVRKDIFIHTARNCLFAMIVIKCALIERETLQADCLALSVLILEYLFAMAVLYVLCDKIYEMIASGYQLKSRGDGSFAPTSVLISEKETENTEIYNVKGLFLDIKTTMDGMVRGKNKKFELQVDNALPVSLNGDRQKLRLAMVNLLSDFLQFTEDGEVTLEVTYEKGITPKRGENITLICRINCSEDISESLRYGNALGFALAKNIIQKMNGILLNKTQSSTGNTCYTASFQQLVEDDMTILELKQKHREEQNALISDSRKNAQGLLFADAVTALIVDDSKTNLKLVNAILKSFGVRSVCASTGDEAIEKVKAKCYDFVLLDHMMPVKGGIQIAKEIRQLGDPYFEQLPLLAMTSSMTDESKQMFYDNGFVEVISKPIQVEELRQTMSHCMFL
jgi:CheY-like chemotaxis protein